ncbi:hypothetical protein E2R68_08460 [Psychromonas sp. RZ22]|uniref:hypothetical protein n=1 Tax=Psychromonas algarum TaxID=2555643 RepID=UPI001067D59D|nr:hypothetical protein [Psychromonas sp. RZ22]TEW54720.1 hypothetical protein E2R68_08460 [Psychromonas sp. RZ22]
MTTSNFSEMHFDTFESALDWEFQHSPDGETIYELRYGKGWITARKEDMPEIRNYEDKWGGENYGCYPIKVDGEAKKNFLEASEEWSLVMSEEYIDERNDNQRDIHSGSNFTYKNEVEDKIVKIYMGKSRTGKTVNWQFIIFKNASENLLLRSKYFKLGLNK